MIFSFIQCWTNNNYPFSPSFTASVFQIMTKPKNITLWLQLLTAGKTTNKVSVPYWTPSKLRISKNSVIIPTILELWTNGYDPSLPIKRTSSCQDLQVKSEKNIFSKNKGKEEHLGNTMDTTLCNVSMTFHQNSHRNPTLDESGQKYIIIKRQIKCYRDIDPPPNGQQCLPFSIFEKMYQSSSYGLNQALGQLIFGTLFFPMHSCEYSKVKNSEDRKNKLLWLCNIKFYKNFQEVTNLDDIKDAEIGQIIFEFQKTDKKSQSFFNIEPHLLHVQSKFGLKSKNEYCCIQEHLKIQR